MQVPRPPSLQPRLTVVSMAAEPPPKTAPTIFQRLRGVVTPTNQQQSPQQLAKQQRGRADESPDEGEELSIRELLSQYGVIAILFHFSVWITCLASGKRAAAPELCSARP